MGKPKDRNEIFAFRTVVRCECGSLETRRTGSNGRKQSRRCDSCGRVFFVVGTRV